MCPYFKNFLKKSVVGGVAGAVFGSVCGSGSSVIAISNGCNSNLALDEATLVSNGVLSGTVASACIGALMGMTVYPAYKIFLERGWFTFSQIVNEEVYGEGIRIEQKNSI